MLIICGYGWGEEGKSSFRDTGEGSPLASFEFVITIPANIRTLFSEGKEANSETPEDISGKKAEIIQYRCAPMRPKFPLKTIISG